MLFSNFFYTILTVFNTFETTIGSPLSDLAGKFTTFTIVSAVIYLALFILKGIGIYMLSVNNGVDNGWLGFIPFVSYFQLGRLIGPMSLFRVRFKNIGILLGILYLVTFVMGAVLDYIQYFEAFERAVNSDTLALAFDGNRIISEDTPLILTFGLIQAIISLVYVIVMVFVVIAFFRLYAPNRAILYAIICIFFESLLGIFIFSVRKNKKGSFYAYNPYARQGRGPDGAYYGDGGRDASRESPFTEYDRSAPDKDVFEDYPDSNRSGGKGADNESNERNKDDDLF